MTAIRAMALGAQAFQHGSEADEAPRGERAVAAREHGVPLLDEAVEQVGRDRRAAHELAAARARDAQGFAQARRQVEAGARQLEADAICQRLVARQPQADFDGWKVALEREFGVELVRRFAALAPEAADSYRQRLLVEAGGVES